MELNAILIAVFFATASATSVEMNNISISNTTESWMTPEEFSSVIEASFTVIGCVNIITCDREAGTGRLLKEFISVFPAEYTLNAVVDRCIRYLMVASSANEYLLCLILRERSFTDPSTELLVVIDEDIGEPIEGMDYRYDFGIWTFWLYSNANVNFAAPNGLFKLSDNYLYTRTFSKVSSYYSMVHKKGIVDLEGRELIASTFYNPPYCFLNSTEESDDPWSLLYFTADDEERDGVEVNLFLLIGKRLNATVKFSKPNNDYRYDKRGDNNWKGGLIGEVQYGNVTVAFGSIWLTLEDVFDISLTIPWRQNHLHFLVPRPKPHLSFWALTAPLTPESWAAMIAMLIVQSIFVYTRAWVNPLVPRRFRSFTNTWTEMMARLLGTWAPDEMRCLRALLTLWHFIGVLMVTAFSSGLAAKLTSGEYDARIDTIEDFIAANLTWGLGEYVKSPSSAFDTSDPNMKLLINRFEVESSDEERHEKILKGKYAIFGSRIGSSFFPLETITDDDLQGYRVMRDSVGDNYITFAVKSWLKDSFDTVLLRLQEGGLIEYHLNDVIYRRVRSGLHQVLFEQDFNTGEPRVLELIPLGAGFMLWLVALFISTIVLYFELRSVKGPRSIREVLIEIKNNREVWPAEKLKTTSLISELMKLKWKRRDLISPRKINWATDSRKHRSALL